jgi:ATP-dependent DNA ligase
VCVTPAKARRTLPGCQPSDLQCWRSLAVFGEASLLTFEIKFDGYRCIVVKRGREVTLFSRHEKVLNRRFPGIVDALSSLDGDFVFDGELVALDSQGRPSFQLLQGAFSQSLRIYFYTFDLLHRNGELLVNLPFSRRRELLENLLASPDDPLRLSPLLRAPSGQVLAAVRKLGLEGVVGKRVELHGAQQHLVEACKRSSRATPANSGFAGR